MKNILSIICRLFTLKAQPSHFSEHIPFELILFKASTLVIIIFGTTLTAFGATANLSWSANTETDLAGYKVYYGTAPGVYGAPIDVGNQAVGNQVNHTLTGLSINTYYFAVTAYDTSGNESEKSLEVSQAISGADTSAPLVSSIGVSGISATGATISWTTNEAADTQLEYGTTTSYGTMTSLDSALLTSHSTTLAGLLAATTYHYRVLSRDGAGNLTTSGDNTFLTTTSPDTTAPSISGIASSSPTSTTATITWSTNEGASSRVEYGPTQSYGSSSQSSVLVTNHSRSLLSLAPSITYNYRVISTDAVGNTATSGNFTFTTTAAGTSSDPQQLISNLVVANGKPYGVIQNGLSNGVLTYIDRVYTYSSIPVWLQGAAYIKTAMDDKLSQSLPFLSFDVNQPVTVYIAYLDAYETKPDWLVSFADTGDNLVVNGNTFSIFQKEFPSGTVILGGNVHPSETSEYSMYTVFVLQANTGSTDLSPPVLSSINVSNITSTGAVITWTTNEAATSQIEYGLTSAYGLTTPKNDTLLFSHKQTLTELLEESTYHFRVKSLDTKGNSSFSGDKTFQTGKKPSSDVTPPDDILGFHAIGGNRQITLSWKNPPDLDFVGVRIRYRTDRSPKDIKDGTLLGDISGIPNAEMTTSHTGLINGVTYYYLAASYDGRGNFQSTVFVSVKAGVPSTGGQDSDSPDETVGGCGMVFPRDGNSSGPGDAAGMLTLIGAMILMLIKGRLRSSLLKLRG